MDEPPIDERPDDVTGPGEDHRMPGWVRGFLLAAIVVAVLVAVLLLSGGHGPGRHG